MANIVTVKDVELIEAGEVWHTSTCDSPELRAAFVPASQHGTLYDDPGADYFTRLHPDRARNRALHQLQAMGYHVTLDRVG